MKKVLNILLNIIKYICLLIFVAYVGLLAAQKLSDNKLSLAGYRIFTVVSESMVPRYEIGDVVIVKNVNPSEVKVGQDLCYLGKEADFAGKVVTHEVKEVNKDESGNYVYITEGIANVMPDPEVRQDQIYGVVKHKSKVLSFLGKALKNKIVFFLVIFVPILIYIIMKVYKVIDDVTEEDEDETEDKED